MSHSRATAIGINRAAHLGERFGYKLAALAAAVGIALLVLATPQPALSSVFTSGDVIPTDNPFVPGDDGLPLNGNVIEVFEPSFRQTHFEGIHSTGTIPDDPVDDENLNSDIIVGESAFGVVLISGGSALRFNHLIIGDEGERVPGGLIFKGTGVMRINGFGSLYNNNPEILPPGLPIGFRSLMPRDQHSDYADGFDLYVGRAGAGTLEISLGGRAEIDDAVVVGDQPGSLGTIIVDGFDSFLGSGGRLTQSGNDQDEVRSMFIGRLGSGHMIIRNGGRVVADARGAGQQDDVVAAVIGSRPRDTGDAPELGGEGTVTVTGAPNGLSSQWILGGSLQIGGFHDFSATDIANQSGVNAIYDSSVGRGTLNVDEGGIVQVRFPVEVTPADEVDLRVLIGRFGRLELTNGLVTIGTGDPEGSQGDARDDAVQLLNDGVIRGGGRINTGVFRNRFFGEVRVDAGQRLIIDSSTEVITGGDLVQPLVNWGLMQVIGSPEARRVGN